MIKKIIMKWKLQQDDKRDNEIFRHLRNYWFSFRRKDVVVNIILQMDFTNEELYQISNIAGQLAHQRERRDNDKKEF